VTSRRDERGAPRAYDSPAAFRSALEARLRRHAAKTGQPLLRVQRVWTYDRFLARLEQEDGSELVVKGGMALELRLERARMTGDIDVRWTIEPDAVLERLREGGLRDLRDFLRFEVRIDQEHPQMDEATRYEGRRFRIDAFLGGKAFFGFGLDVISGGPMVREPDVVIAEDLLDFIGVPPPGVRVLPVETHIAEKLHAYTVPRPFANSRVRDLPDLALLATTGPMRAEELRRAIELTFEHRRTHSVPAAFPAPSAQWGAEYARIAGENALAWRNLAEVTDAVRRFLEPVLAGDGGLWTPEGWSWQAS
jgi:hypothetical protein